MRRERHAQLRSTRPAASIGRSRTEESYRGRRKPQADAYHTVTYSRRRHRRFLAEGRSVPVISFSGRKGEAGKKDHLNFSKSRRANSLERRRNTPLHLTLGADVLVPSSRFGTQQRVPSRALPGQVRNETGGKLAALPIHPSQRSRGRIVCSERHARRATGEPGRTASGSRRMALAGGASTHRSTAGGAWWRWRRRADEVRDAVTSWFRGVLADVQNRLSDAKANRGEKS
jgi:hypothetical protein